MICGKVLLNNLRFFYQVAAGKGGKQKAAGMMPAAWSK
jgi:hypothetical protein